MEYFKRLLGTAILAGTAAVGFAGCGDDGGSGGSGANNTGGSGGSGAGSSGGVCILNNCTENEHCAGCAEGRTNCRIEAGEDYGRCVACGPDGTGCPEGQVCSAWGNCVPEGLECPTDNDGVPQISCTNSGDCAACAPNYQLCDTATGLCVACTEDNTSLCQSTEICKDNKCAQACAADCTVDNDCGQCGTAKACNKHKCSQCSKTYACPSGEQCDLNTGTCEKICGLPDAPGVCDDDTDCAGCGGMQTKCHVPINGGMGTCGPTAAGCSDLGEGALALPPPYNQITDTCSNDADCAGVGITYNVGEALRDLIGTDEILGQPIEDANIEYPMAACAAITLANNSCGVCVPCRDDNDCQDIDISGLAGDLFPGVGAWVIDALFDAIFGPNDKKLYMYCESVAAGYGVCVPCPGLLNDCAPGGGGGGGGSGTCDHPADQTGGPLDPTCDDCAATVCEFDPFCCDQEWDQLCVDEAADNCGASQCHDPCETGDPMGGDCGACEGDVCAEDPYCCNTAWDSTCVSTAETLCGLTCN